MAENKPLDVDAYLQRIKYKGPPGNSLETLRELHACHAFNIPFENLDIHLGRRISLDQTALFNKLIKDKRGGYCHEINSLFYYLLKRLGFNVNLLMARVMLGSELTAPKLHQLLLVEIAGGNWIVDPGFGGNGLIAPLPLKEGSEEKQFSEKFRLLTDEIRGHILQSGMENKWLSLYSFDLAFYYPVDYTPANYFSSTSPDSVFTQKRICMKPTPEGRIVLTDMELNIRRNGISTKHRITGPQEYLEILQKHFGIELPANTKFQAGMTQ